MEIKYEEICKCPKCGEMLSYCGSGSYICGECESDDEYDIEDFYKWGYEKGKEYALGEKAE